MGRLERVLDYHQSTKHRLGRFARGPQYLDWATQPDAFRRYQGAELIELPRLPAGNHPPYEPSFAVGHIEPVGLDLQAVSQLFFDSLAISAWKRAGDATWALRVNPSSGNLHPTEGYLICGQVDGLTDTPIIAHYTPREHGLEVRAKIPQDLWKALSVELPAGTILLGLTSIHWREAWKYGERAFRYCQHDAGHALAAISIAAAGLGWQATLLDELGTDQQGNLLGVLDLRGTEEEHPDCLLAIYPQGRSCSQLGLPKPALTALAQLSWTGKANLLSPSHVEWSAIDKVATATEKPPSQRVYDQPRAPTATLQPPEAASAPFSLRQIIHQRRSAVAMDEQGRISRDVFFKILSKTLAGSGRFPFNTLPWRPLIHLVLFVHRVYDLAPGLYLLLREPAEREELQAAMRDDFSWKKPPSCPAHLELYRLATGDVRTIARQLSCQQAIASDGCFSLGMLASFQQPLERFGPWFYRRLYWECGMIGQVLYLEAEAAGIRGTGIGCFFDDAVHELLGLETMQYQSLYHFTVGSPVRDERLATLPAYPPS